MICPVEPAAIVIDERKVRHTPRPGRLTRRDDRARQFYHEGTGGFVEDDDLSIAQKRPHQCYLLPFAET